MKRNTRIFGLAVLAAVGTLIAITTFASADDLHNSLSNSHHGGPNQAQTGEAFAVLFWVTAQPGDEGDTTGPDGEKCNPANGTSAFVTMNFPSGSGLSANENPVEITDCTNPQNGVLMTICPTKPGTFSRLAGTNLTASVTDADGSEYDILNADIELTVTGDPVDDCDGGGGGGGGNLPPEVSDDAENVSGNEGDTLENDGAFTDPNGDDLTLSATDGDGNALPPEMSFTDNGDGTWDWSFPTVDNYSGTVKVIALDPLGETAVDTFDWSTANVDPDIAEPLTVAGSVCQPTVSFEFTDPGTADLWSHAVNFDGTDALSLIPAFPDASYVGSATQPVQVGPIAKPTPYPITGTKTITVGVKDDDGGSDEVSATHEIPAVVGSAGFGPPVQINGNGKGLFNSGQTIPVKVRVSACADAFTHVPGLFLRVLPLIPGATNINGAIIQPNTNVKADVGGWMRESGYQYIYNLATKKTDVTGTYMLAVEQVTSKSVPVGEGTIIAAKEIALKR